MKKLLIFLFFFSFPSYALDTTRAVVVPHGAHLVSSGIPDSDLSPLSSTSGLVCLWYKTSYMPALDTAMTFIHVQTPSHLLFQVSLVNVSGYLSPELFVGDDQGRFMHATSLTAAPHNGVWTSIGWTWSTTTFQVKGLVNATPMSIQVARDGSGVGAQVNFRAANFWSVFADVDHAANGFDFFAGSAAQIMMHVGSGDYLSIVTPTRLLPGCAQTIVTPSRTVTGPVEWGPGCNGIFGVPQSVNDYSPILCLIGGVATFRYNQGGDTQFAYAPGSLSLGIAPDDPWSLYSDLSPNVKTPTININNYGDRGRRMRMFRGEVWR